MAHSFIGVDCPDVFGTSSHTHTGLQCLPIPLVADNIRCNAVVLARSQNCLKSSAERRIGALTFYQTLNLCSRLLFDNLKIEVHAQWSDKSSAHGCTTWIYVLQHGIHFLPYPIRRFLAFMCLKPSHRTTTKCQPKSVPVMVRSKNLLVHSEIRREQPLVIV